LYPLHEFSVDRANSLLPVAIEVTAVEFVQIADRRNSDDVLEFKTGPGTWGNAKFDMNNMPTKSFNFMACVFKVNVRIKE
jgi:hypothetical protein